MIVVIGNNIIGIIDNIYTTCMVKSSKKTLTLPKPNGTVIQEEIVDNHQLKSMQCVL